MPEYTQFESAEATDLVSLATGKFTYSIPVMTVPGPGLGFPIVLGYHSNPAVKDEASWVGLGWELQAGAISRQVNRIPDDYKNVEILESITSDKIYGISFSIDYNVGTVGITYSANQGIGGFIGYNILHRLKAQPFSVVPTVGFGSAKGATGVSLGVQKGYSVGSGQNFGIGIGAQVSLNSSGAAGSINASLSTQMGSASSAISQSAWASMMGLGISLSEKGGMGVGGSLLGVGAEFSAKANTTYSLESSATFLIPTPGPSPFAALKYSKTTTWLSGRGRDRYFGFLYDDKNGMGCTGTSGNIDCNYPVGRVYRKRQEFQSADKSFVSGSEAKLMRTTEDSYFAMAQGMSGTFMPHRKEDGDYANTLEGTSKWDFWDFERDYQDRTAQLGYYRNFLNSQGQLSQTDDQLNDVYWRFADDAGGAEYGNPNLRDGDPAKVSRQSRRIKPSFDSNGKIVGFTLTSTDGVKYEFLFPLQNLWDRKTGFEWDNYNPDINTKQETHESYAYAWLLTSIKSIDYVDLGQPGVSDEDIGGWVKFTYGDGTENGSGIKKVQYWSTPYYDPFHAFFTTKIPQNEMVLAKTSPTPQSRTGAVSDGMAFSASRNAAQGAKEIAFLRSIETPTHIAEFRTSPRLDNEPFKTTHFSNVFSQVPTAASAVFTTTDYTYNGQTFFRTSIQLNIPEGTQHIQGVPETAMNTNDIVDVILDVEYDWVFQPPMSYTSCQSAASNPVRISIGITGYHIGTNQNYNDKTVFNEFVHLSCGTALRVVAIRVQPQSTIPNKSVKLNSIILKDKAAIRETPVDDGSLNSPHRGVGFVQFGTDYNLCQGTPNSLAPAPHSKEVGHGKLTLNWLAISQSERGPELPRFYFNYTNNPKYQNTDKYSGINGWVPWETANWDRWGNLCTKCSDDYHEPDFIDADGAVSSSAWNLDQIKTPSGAEIFVKYSPTAFNYVGQSPYSQSLQNNEYQIPIARGGADYLRDGPFMRYPIFLGAIRKKFVDRGLTINRFRLVFSSNKALEEFGMAHTKEEANKIPDDGYFRYVINQPRHWSPGAILGFDYVNCSTQANGLSCQVSDGTTSIYGIDKTISASEVIGNDLWLGFLDRQTQPPSNPRDLNSEYTLYAIVSPASGKEKFATEDYANGAVVTDVEMREPYKGASQKIHYEYTDGVTASLPGTFSAYSDARSAVHTGTEFYAGAPSVIYSKVSTTINGKNKTDHHFLTSRTLPVIFGAPSSETSDPSGSKFTSMSITDLSNLWGALWKKEEFTDGQTTPIRTSRTTWGINLASNSTEFASIQSALPETGILEPYDQKPDGQYYISKSSWQANSVQNFGKQQTVFSNRYFNANGCYVGSCPQSNILTTQVVHKKLTPHSLRDESIENGVKLQTFHFNYDFLTGTALKSKRVNSDNTVLVSESVPAYYRYTEMYTANSLTQGYSQANYRYLPSDDYTIGQAENPAKAISANFTMWRPFTKDGVWSDGIARGLIQAFRKFKTATWKSDLNVQGGSLSLPSDFCASLNEGSDLVECTAYLSASLPSSWFVNEQVNRYDAYGHPTDVMDQRKINNSLLYGYQHAFPTAFVQNTSIPSATADKKLQAFYESFESKEDVTGKLSNPGFSASFLVSKSLSKTGISSLEVKNTETSVMTCFDLGYLEAGKSYEASVWYYDASDGLNPSNINATRPGLFLGKDGGCASEVHPNGVSHGPGVGAGDINFESRAVGSKTWKRLKAVIESGQCNLPSALTPAMVCLYASKGNSGLSVLYDELRVKPMRSYMTTYTYNAWGKINSSADVREVVTKYEYDANGNLTGIRNDDGFLISEQYKNAGSQ